MTSSLCCTRLRQPVPFRRPVSRTIGPMYPVSPRPRRVGHCCVEVRLQYTVPPQH
jgi:hypothetical protein